MKIKTLLNKLNGDTEITFRNWKTGEEKKFSTPRKALEELTEAELEAKVLIIECLDYNEIYISTEMN